MEIQVPFDERFGVLPGSFHYRYRFAHRGKHLFVHALGCQRCDFWFEDFANLRKMYGAFGWSAADHPIQRLLDGARCVVGDEGSPARVSLDQPLFTKSFHGLTNCCPAYSEL